MTKSFLFCAAAYAVAITAGLAVVLLLPAAPPLVRVGVADLVATVSIFGFSLVFNNSSFYDPYWSVAPVFIGLFWLLQAAPQPLALRQVVVCALLLGWAVRLTYNWASGWRGLEHEDWRYKDFRVQTGPFYWWVSLLGIHLFPTVMVFLGCLPLQYSLTFGARSLNGLDWVAIVITAGAIAIEAIADVQLRRFIKAGPAPEGVMTNGLWAISRHPNYFGEASFWCGMFAFGLAANSGALWTAVGCLVILGLFVFISIPLMEQHMLRHRPAFAEYQARVSMFIPWRSRPQ